MRKIIIQQPELILVGITVRTNNTNEGNPSTAKISPTVQKYFHGALADTIQNRKTPGNTYCVYTDYESDASGEYTYFIGEAVTNIIHVPDDMTKLIIPAQTYAKFTNGPAPMPEVCISAWHDIWGMTPSDLGGPRAYIADFELYDQRAQDHQRVELDIYIGIQPESI